MVLSLEIVVHGMRMCMSKTFFM